MLIIIFFTTAVPNSLSQSSVHS